MRQILRSPACWVILATVGIATATNLAAPNGGHLASTVADDRQSLEKMANEIRIQREGTTLTDVKGRFKKQAERYVFAEENTGNSYKCLENMGLQRVAGTIKDEDRKVSWLISAKLTEFNEENYLIIEKAVKTR